MPGHYLGMDIHDCAMINNDRPLEPGVVSHSIKFIISVFFSLVCLERLMIFFKISFA